MGGLCLLSEQCRFPVNIKFRAEGPGVCDLICIGLFFVCFKHLFLHASVCHARYHRVYYRRPQTEFALSKLLAIKHMCRCIRVLVMSADASGF